MLQKYFIVLLALVCGLKSMAQDSSLFNSSWADSLKTAIQDSARNKNKVAAAHKTTAPVILKDTAAALNQSDISDQISATDTILQIANNDSVHQNAISDSTVNFISKLKNDSIARASAKSKHITIQNGMQGAIKNNAGTDIIFYVLIFIVFFLALIKKSFPKYFNNIFSLSFQATFRQTQTREQMSQNFFPAFMLNVLFILSGGLFITLFAQFYKLTIIPFWQLFIYSTVILGIIYTIKFFVILFTGWVFNAPDAAADYRFIVFLINKLVGVLFIPVLFVIAYTDDEVKKIAITVALCIAGSMIALRYLVSLARIKRNLNLSAFHFFIYLCAVEIMPLLIIYKLLFIKTGNT